MLIREVRCPECSEGFIVDEELWRVGSVKLHCPSCQNYFEPEGSPSEGSPGQVANASVPITIWEPAERRDFPRR